MTELETKLNRRPIVELLMLALPTVAQMASYTFMQFADRWMLAQVGDWEATAAGTAGLTYFCFLGFGFGVIMIVNTLVSQSFGREDYSATGQYLWQGIWFGMAFGLLTMVLYPLAPWIFQLMRHEPRMIGFETEYLRVVTLASCVKLVALAMGQFLLALHRPNIVFFATLVGVGGDLFSSWLLIYGHWGFPQMGVAGSAWGTNIGVAIELVVLGIYIAVPSFARKHNAGDFQFRWPMFRTLLKVGVPAGFQFICDITAWMIFMNVIVATFGTPALSANSFAFSYMHLCFMPAVGVAQAVTSLVGKYIGMGRHDLAARRAHLGFVVCAIYMVLAGISLYVYRYPLISVFSKDPEVLRIGGTIMLFIALYQIFDAMFVVYVGALRGAGDTMVPAAVQAVLVWSIVVGGGTIIINVAPEYGVIGPWTLATIFGAILGLFLLTRFVKGGWKNIRLHDQEQPTSNVTVDSAKLSAVTETYP